MGFSVIHDDRYLTMSSRELPVCSPPAIVIESVRDAHNVPVRFGAGKLPSSPRPEIAAQAPKIKFC